MKNALEKVFRRTRKPEFEVPASVKELNKWSHPLVESGEWAEWWSRVALDATPELLDEDELAAIYDATKQIYAAAKLPTPRVVVVPSPYVLAMAGGAAAWYWHTRAMPGDATEAATDAATRAATDAATRAATHAATDDATRAEIRCGSLFYRCYQGGNMWAGWLSYASALIDLGGLNIACIKAHKAYETLGLLSGFRWMHEKFCLVSEKPVYLKVELRNNVWVAHCDNGPSHLWRDGYAIWNLDGIHVDEQIVMRPESQTIEQINGEQNADIRAIRIQRFGWARYLTETKSKCLDECRNDVEGTREALYVSPSGERRLVATCPTGRVFAMGVPNEVVNCEQARKWLQPKPFNILART